jgi:hypothetical protein
VVKVCLFYFLMKGEKVCSNLFDHEHVCGLVRIFGRS